jgi:hypothetical protein
LLAAHPQVQTRWVDLEAFSADSSDLLLVETDDLREWNCLFEALRDTASSASPTSGWSGSWELKQPQPAAAPADRSRICSEQLRPVRRVPLLGLGQPQQDLPVLPGAPLRERAVDPRLLLLVGQRRRQRRTEDDPPAARRLAPRRAAGDCSSGRCWPT